MYAKSIIDFIKQIHETSNPMKNDLRIMAIL